MEQEREYSKVEETLFPLPPRQEEPGQEALGGRPRLKRPDRLQVSFRPSSLDDLVSQDHAVRMVWQFVEGLELSPLYGRIRAVEGHAGQSAIDPKILMALWLYATSEGVGSARELDRLCREHMAYLWILGGVTVNYHTLADFRVREDDLLDRLLSESVAALMAEGLVSLRRTAQDGIRVRASAGSDSFRRRETLEACRRAAQEEVQRLRRELEVDPGGPSRRQRAARERASRERAARVKRALGHVRQIERQRAKSHRKPGKHAPPRASTTDPEARVMKMPDGGFRPAYNAQLVVDTQARVIVGLEVVNAPDAGQMAPMIAELAQRYGQVPQEHLVDAGYAILEDIQTVSPPQGGTVVYAPLPKAKPRAKPAPANRPPPAPTVAAWRERMQTEQAQVIYHERASTVEWANAQLRNRGLQQFRVRGLRKVRAVLLWFALLHNLLQGRALRLLARGAAMGAAS